MASKKRAPRSTGKPPRYVWLFADSSGRIWPRPQTLLDDYTSHRYRLDDPPTPRRKRHGRP
jgi:hypothetical protein